MYVISAKGKDTLNLTGALDRWSSSPEWSADSKTVYFTAQNYGRVNLYSAPVTAGKVTPLIDEEGQVRDFSVSRSGELFYAFSDLCVGDLGGGDYKDIMAGVEYVARQYPFIDSTRMGVTSISNLISMWGTGCNTDWFESDMGFMPIDDFEKTWSISPLKYVKNCRTPTMFVSGQWDFVTTLYQSEEMFTALKKMGVDAAIASYPNEGHGVRSQPRHGADYYRRSVAWFDRYLK